MRKVIVVIMLLTTVLLASCGQAVRTNLQQASAPVKEADKALVKSNQSVKKSPDIKNNTLEEATYSFVTALRSGDEAVIEALNKNSSGYDTKTLLKLSDDYFSKLRNGDISYYYGDEFKDKGIAFIQVDRESDGPIKYMAIKMVDNNGKYYFDTFTDDEEQNGIFKKKNNILFSTLMVGQNAIKNGSMEELALTFSRALTTGDKEVIKAISSSRLKDKIDTVIPDAYYNSMRQYADVPVQARVFDGYTSATLDYGNNTLLEIMIAEEGGKYYFDGFFEEDNAPDDVIDLDKYAKVDGQYKDEDILDAANLIQEASAEATKNTAQAMEKLINDRVVFKNFTTVKVDGKTDIFATNKKNMEFGDKSTYDIYIGLNYDQNSKIVYTLEEMKAAAMQIYEAASNVAKGKIPSSNQIKYNMNYYNIYIGYNKDDVVTAYKIALFDNCDFEEAWNARTSP